MPRAYSQDLRWRAIWLTEIMGFHMDEVSILLQMSKKTISRYIRKFRMLGHVDTAVIGRPYACIAMHPHEELVIMEVLLQHPERTLPEIVQEVYQETGSEYACSTLHYYLKRNNITRKKVGIFYNVVPIVIIITLRLHACVLFKAKLICLAS